MFRTLRIAVLLMTTGSAYVMSQTNTVQISSGSVELGSFVAFEKEHEIKLQVKAFQATISHHDSSPEVVDVLMLYSPTSRLLWWNYSPHASSRIGIKERLLENSFVYIAEQKITKFTLVTPILWIRDSEQKCLSLIECGKVVLNDLQKVSGPVEANFAEGYHTVGLGESLSHSFLYPKWTASPFPQPRLKKVRRIDAEWEVLVDGPNGDSAIIKLNDMYELIGAQILPPKP